MIFTFAWYPGHKEELHLALLGGYSLGLPCVALALRAASSSANPR